MILLDDRTSEGSDLQLQSIAHGVITLEQLAPVYGAERRRLRVMKFRGTDYRGGYHDFAIRKGGSSFFRGWWRPNIGGQFPRERIKSGVTALDTLLGGGPDRGTSTLLMGPAGSGKSTIAVQYAVAAAERGDHAVIFGFDESIETLEARTQSPGNQITAGERGRADRPPTDRPGGDSPGEFACRVCAVVEQDKARVVVIDSLNGYMNAMPEEQFLTAQLHELLTLPGAAGSHDADGRCAARLNRDTDAVARRYQLPGRLGHPAAVL